MSSASSYSKSFWVSFLVGVWNRRQRPQAKKVELEKNKFQSFQMMMMMLLQQLLLFLFFLFFFSIWKNTRNKPTCLFLEGRGRCGSFEKGHLISYIYFYQNLKIWRERMREARGQNSCHRHKVQREHVHIKKYKNQGSWASSYYISFSL
jgi:hypothetical protein